MDAPARPPACSVGCYVTAYGIDVAFWVSLALPPTIDPTSPGARHAATRPLSHPRLSRAPGLYSAAAAAWPPAEVSVELSSPCSTSLRRR